MTEPNVQVPETIGDYRIDGRLGAGGMGEVFRAWDPALERPVAIKLIRSDAPRNAAALERFRREALAIAHLDHPSIVRIHHVQKWREHPCLVMELVEGEPLARVLKRGPLAAETALRLLAQIASGLAVAHAKGIVHRDLKAQNVMLTPEGRAKILDFGIAKRLQGRDESLSVTGAILGTLHTMSPEQAAGKPVDGRADLFALGVLAYEMLTATSPFRAATAVETLARVISHHPQSVQTIAPQIPSPLSRLIDRLLAKDPADRPSTARDVADALHALSAESLPSQRPHRDEVVTPSGSGETPVLVESEASSWTGLPTLKAGRPTQAEGLADPESASGSLEGSGARHQRALVRRRGALVLVAAAIILLLVAGFYWHSARQRGPLTVAVAGLAPADAEAAPWQTALLEDALILELRGHPSLRVLDGASMLRLRRALGYPQTLAPSELEGFRSALSKDLADVLVTGIWHRRDGAWDVRLELSRSLSDTSREVDASGPTISETARSLSATVSEALGLGPIATASHPFSAVLPAGSDALRLYAEGLLAHRQGDLTVARSRYAEALAVEPDHAELHRAYAVASDFLGYETEAKRAAGQTIELARRLQPDVGDPIRAAGYAISGDLRSAVETYERLFERYPDELAFAVEAARLRSLSDDNLSALAPIERLRPLAKGFYASRLDLIEARVRNDTGDFVTAKVLADRAASFGAHTGLVSLEAEGRLLEGTALAHLGEHAGADQAINQAHLLFQKVGERRRAFDALLENALLLYEQGQDEAALDYLQRYEQLFTERDDPWSIAMLQNNMGIMRIYQGRLQEACDLFDKAISVFEQRGDWLELAQALLNLGAAQHWNGDLSAAVAAYERAEPIFLQFGDRPNLAAVRINLGEIQRDTGALDLAAATFQEALALERELGRPVDIAYALNRLGEIALLREELSNARDRFTESLGLVEAIGDPSSLAQAQLGLAQVELAASNAGRAETLATQAEQRFLDSGDLPSAHRASLYRARALLQRTPPDIALARELYDTVHLSAGQVEDWRLRVEIELLAARLGVETREDPERLIRARLEALITECASAGLVLDEQQARLALGELEMAVGTVDVGRRHLQAVMDAARAEGWTQYARRAARHLDG